MSFLDIILTGALIAESVLLILLVHFYKKEKERVQIEKTKRAEDKKYIDIFIEHLEKRAETYEILLEFKRILEEAYKDAI
ncbi:MAG TPA: hypothetical protein DEQ64_17245 [Lachnoclostridium sp.]|jgi:hypothetical protein|uniref:hypothetical protein n=1 Tax=Lacrimispora sp. TaxID=2719234 RepID=UPI000EEC8DE0|nr:hypothetical protein [Lacrimispora sp.]HCD45438.1 hypothetical protein [Lachnoclostridium sp.]